MRLSEAMRLGAMIRPQIRGNLRGVIRTGFLGLFGKAVNGSCALGAAFEAGGCAEVPGVVAKGVIAPFRGSALKQGDALTVVMTPD